MTDPQIAVSLIATTGVGWMMVVAGLGKSGLELRRRKRICPSCGREIHSRVCGCPR
jgi:hypothetical protein